MDAAAGPFALHADGFQRNADSYDTPLGAQDNSFFRGTGMSLGGSYFFGNDSHVGAAVVQYDAKYGIPSDTTFILMRQTKFLSRSSLDIGYGPLQALNLDFGYANYSHEEKDPDGTVNTTFKNKEFDGRAEQLLGEIGPFSSSAVGLQVQNREYSALGADGSYLFPTFTTSFAGFAFAEAPIADALHLQVSARVENVHITGTPASNVPTVLDFTPISGAAGVLYDATDWLKLGLTASTAARAPAQTELFARGPHDGPGTFETGDPTLKTERANALEGTLRVRLEKFSVEASAWSSWFDNFIYGQLTGRTCDNFGNCVPGNSAELKELNYAQQGAHFWGLEGKASYQLWKPDSGALSADVQGDTVRATLADGNNVPRIPPYKIGGGFSWASTKVDAGILFLYVGRQNDFGLFDTPTPSYVELNANIAWWPLDSNPGLELLLVGHNLADTQQRNAASLNKDDILQPGRDIRIVLRQAF
jgi:iron complex outermembrane receptor protein